MSTATVKATITKADSARERELYLYFQPPERSAATLRANNASPPDTSLTALAQLCALRLNAKRAVISVLDRQNQYFIAEATRTWDLVNNDKAEVEGNGLWFGGGTMDKSGRLCEKTIELAPCLSRAPCFTVTNLQTDERFNQLPFVTRPPYFKFYAGTPITTKKGINIGSIFIIDDTVREKLSEDQERFLGITAQTVMKHMEITSEAAECKKVMRLSLGMNAFIEGKGRLNRDEIHENPSLSPRKLSNNVERSSRPKKSESTIRLKGSPSKDSVLLLKHRDAENVPLSEPDSSQDDSDSGPATRTVDIGHRETFSRAANILSESLNLKGRGGVVFYDTTSGLGMRHQERSERRSHRPAEIISCSPSERNLEFEDQTTRTQAFSPIDEDLLLSLLTRYHRGKMWTFDQDGNLSSSEEDIIPTNSTSNASENQTRSSSSRRQREITQLRHYFPGISQLLFSGLWDAGSSRWFAAGFAWTTCHRQIFTRETELSFFLSFRNSVMAEVSRLASIVADRQKADFIGSISHEFRSPLHGILASAEFLAETEIDTFQSSLVDTISSCGRTLLDTINHILDYSKINSFERSWRNVRKPGSKIKGSASRALADKEAPPMMNIYATIDVASVLEEVVEGVCAGQLYQDISSTEATDFSIAGKAAIADRGIGQRKWSKAKEVDVQIDITHEDYIFTTQPGALKRVIMNIFGNALKYITKGFITVSLSLDSLDNAPEGSVHERVLELKVCDTGKGISSHYLRTSLFTPFCQEDPLASGTGLGLSIVKSIVTMLKGTVDVQSEVGLGTEVTVRLPLSRLPGAATPVSTPSSTNTDSPTEKSINTLKSEYRNASIALLGFNDKAQGRILRNYVHDWFSLAAFSSSSCDSLADVCIIEDENFAELIRHAQNIKSIIVLCSNVNRTNTAHRHHLSNVIEYLSKPIGPRKLAKALRSCLHRARQFQSELGPMIAIQDEESPMESVADTVIAGLEMEHLTLDTEAGEKPLEVQTNGVVTASESENAQMAIDSTSCTSETTATEQETFPFPKQDDLSNGKPSQSENDTSEAEDAPLRGDLTRRDSRRPALSKRMTEPLAKSVYPHSSKALGRYDEGNTLPVKPLHDTEVAQKDAGQGSRDTRNLTISNIARHNGETSVPEKANQPEEQEKRPPRLLLVDDNKINLRLLETYMRKRKYAFVDSAENGQLAVQAAEGHELGYDIIFMDISMPVMNGFEATRSIRSHEEARAHNSKQGEAPPPALIIALTGLASSRDQTEAFTSGVDLFMTKPVSFKEVGKFLDNWEAHGGINPTGKEGNAKS